MVELQISRDCLDSLVLEGDHAENRVEFMQSYTISMSGWCLASMDSQHAPCPILFTAFSFGRVSFPSLPTASSSRKYRILSPELKK